MTLFLRALATAFVLTAASGPAARAEDFAAATGDVILTVTGKIASTNAEGQVALDEAQLAALPQTSFTTTTTWTDGPQTFQGVLLKDLIAASGATGSTITLTAANDYSISMPMADVASDGPLLAYLMNGKPMTLRDKGPVWMVYPYDANEAYRTEEIYSRSIWQLTTIDFGG